MPGILPQSSPHLRSHCCLIIIHAHFLLYVKPCTVVVVAHDVDKVEVFVHLRHVVGSEQGC